MGKKRKSGSQRWERERPAGVVQEGIIHLVPNEQRTTVRVAVQNRQSGHRQMQVWGAWARRERAEARGGNGNGLLGWCRKALYTWCRTNKGPQCEWLFKFGKADTNWCKCGRVIAGTQVVEECPELDQWRPSRAVWKEWREALGGQAVSKKEVQICWVLSFTESTNSFFPFPTRPLSFIDLSFPRDTLSTLFLLFLLLRLGD